MRSSRFFISVIALPAISSIIIVTSMIEIVEQSVTSRVLIVNNLVKRQVETISCSNIYDASDVDNCSTIDIEIEADREE